MVVFIVRRLIVSFFVLIVATFIMYSLTALSGDPFFDLYGIQNAADREARMAARADILNLDQPIPQRYLTWLVGVLGFVLPFVEGTLGTNVNGQDISALLGGALSATLQLVLAASMLAILTGVTIGIVSALRQYSAFDYSITFASFLFFSLPIFWVAILLKQYGAIRLNTWLNDPVITLPWVAGLSLVSALFWTAVVGGRTRRRRLIVFGIALVVTAGLLFYLSAVRWFEFPSLGIPFMILGAVGAAFAVTALTSGLQRRRVLYAALGAAVVGVVVYLATLPILLEDANWLLLLGILVVTMVAAGAVGFAVGGIDKEQAVRAAALTGFVIGVLGFADHVLRAFPDYSRMVLGRPIATIGSNTPNFSGDFWETFLDSATHIVLPSAALILISFATYTRYTRASMLEVMNQDYVRTARSKGLTERTVIMRHAFRNALIPVTTLMAFEFASVLGGAVITETVFGWQGMGNLFITGLTAVDPAPVMGFFLVVGTAVVVFNLVADILYAYLDPRIRLT